MAVLLQCWSSSIAVLVISSQKLSPKFWRSFFSLAKLTYNNPVKTFLTLNSILLKLVLRRMAFLGKKNILLEGSILLTDWIPTRPASDFLKLFKRTKAAGTMSLGNTSLSFTCLVLTIQRKGTQGSLQHTTILLFCCCHRGAMCYNMHTFVFHTENPWVIQYCCRSASEKLGEKVTFPTVIP